MPPVGGNAVSPGLPPRPGPGVGRQAGRRVGVPKEPKVAQHHVLCCSCCFSTLPPARKTKAIYKHPKDPRPSGECDSDPAPRFLPGGQLPWQENTVWPLENSCSSWERENCTILLFVGEGAESVLAGTKKEKPPWFLSSQHSLGLERIKIPVKSRLISGRLMLVLTDEAIQTLLLE